MTAIRKFICNFCGCDVFDCRQAGAVAGAKPGTGIKWSDTETTQVRRCADTENHLCICCLKALRAMPAAELQQWQVQ